MSKWFRGAIEENAVVIDDPYGKVIFRKPNDWSESFLDQIISDHNLAEKARKIKEELLTNP